MRIPNLFGSVINRTVPTHRRNLILNHLSDKKTYPFGVWSKHFVNVRFPRIHFLFFEPLKPKKQSNCLVNVVSWDLHIVQFPFSFASTDDSGTKRIKKQLRFHKLDCFYVPPVSGHFRINSLEFSHNLYYVKLLFDNYSTRIFKRSSEAFLLNSPIHSAYQFPFCKMVSKSFLKDGSIAINNPPLV